MGFDQFFQYVPAFLLSNLFLAYWLWSKFINKNESKIEKPNGFGDILGILFILTTTMIFVLLGLKLPSRLLYFDMYTPTVYLELQLPIFVIGLILLLFSYITFRGKRSRSHLDTILITCLLIQSLIFATYLGWFTAIYFSNYSYYLKLFSPYLIFSLLLIFINLLLVKTLFHGGFRNINKKLQLEIGKVNLGSAWVGLLFCFMLIFFFIIGNSLLPRFQYVEPTIQQYRVSSGGSEIFAKTLYSYKLNPQDGNNFISVLPIKYGAVNFDFSKQYNINARGENGVIYDLIPNYDHLIEFERRGNKRYGLMKVVIDEREKMAFFIFNRDNMSFNLSSINISGSVVEKRSDKFLYDTNPIGQGYCSNNICGFKINFSNKYPITFIYDSVDMDYDNIFSWQSAGNEITNTSLCRISNLTHHNNKYQNFSINCYNNNADCEVYLYENQSYFETKLGVDAGNFWLRYARFHEPVEVEINVTVDCN